MSLVRFRLWAFLFGKEKKLFIISYGVLAQSVEHAAVNRSVVGSSPTGGAFLKKMRLRGQAVKTSPFHGGNTGSIPVGVIDSNLVF